MPTNKKQSPTRPTGLTDRRLKDIERLVNASIHELVFCLQHLEQTSVAPGADNSADLEAADNCLLTITGNIVRIQETIEKALAANPPLPPPMVDCGTCKTINAHYRAKQEAA